MKTADIVFYVARLIALALYLGFIFIGRMYEVTVWFACGFLVLSVSQAVTDLIFEWRENRKNGKKRDLREQKGGGAMRSLRRKAGEFAFSEVRYMQEKGTGGAGTQGNGEKKK